MPAARSALLMSVVLTALSACEGGEGATESRASLSPPDHSVSRASAPLITDTSESQDPQSSPVNTAASTPPSSTAVMAGTSTTVTEPATPLTSPTLTLTDPRTCVDARDDGAGNFELGAAGIAWSDDTLLVATSYLGPSGDRDVFVTFALGDPVYAVVLQRFADGSASAYLVDLVARTELPLEGAHISAGIAQVRIPRAHLDKLDGEVPAFSVVLTVDGSNVDSCPDELT